MYKAIPGLERKFVADDQGIVLSLPNSHHKEPLPMKQYIDAKGFKEVMLDGKWFKVHRLVAILFLPENPEATDAKHINEDITDNRAENLEWVVDKTREPFAKTYLSKDMSSKVFGWSKHGGVRNGLLQENKTPEWYCQACRAKQTDQMPSYMLEVMVGEFVRVCSNCQHIKRQKTVRSFNDLVLIVR